MSSSDRRWQQLQDAIGGDVVLPGSPGYAAALTAPFNARFHERQPQALVRCTSPEDVAATIAFLRRHDLTMVARSGGHCFAGHSSTDGVVLDVTPMDSIRVDGDLVTVGAGARLGPIYHVLQQDGRALPAGTCPAVGIAGLALAGGLGILGRKHGLTSDRMVAAQVVLADGRVVTCDDHRDADLFWALRGAGAGNFGVVTSFVFRTVPAPAMTNIHAAWPFDHAAAVIAAWQGWGPTGPDELAASLKVTTTGDVDHPPSVDVYGAFQGSEADAAALLETLVRQVGAAPVWARLDRMSFPEARQFWAQLPTAAAAEDPQPVGEAEDRSPYFVSRSEFFSRPLPAEAVDHVLANFTRARVPGEERELDFMPWGGAYNRVPADATAFVHRDELFQLKHSAVVDPAAPTASKQAAHEHVQRSWAAVHPWGSGRVFPNFPDPDLENWADAYYGTNYDRLRQIKARYDPGGFFRFPQGVEIPR